MVAEVMIQHWISEFEVPLQLHSDQGRNFTNKTQMTPLHLQSDSIVERFYRTILNNLSLVVSRNEKDWKKRLLFFVLAYRSAVHETISYSPSQMFFDRELHLPCDVFIA
ncbi:hypothetical protein X975_25636, partial [Stegodyphus mimosarum]